MARDIEEFLRRAAERRKQAQQGGGGQQRPPAQRPPAQRQPPKPAPRHTISERDIVPERMAFPEQQPHSIGEESVADHVRRHIDVSDVADHGDYLAENIEQADERLEAHLDQVFDHDVGLLGSGKGATDELIRDANNNSVASGLFRMLQDPSSVRQSILIAEILKRPDFEDDDE
ncbi:hypothetical protein [Mariniblastus fucicola]|uniref:Uncharacterized protein n=1 Tax=Mariniblastus fucicola TaxID=980251 RepID=A0A5B9PGJ0_9BACT|nr:hypothetical protein [Mariniblastus fucicola]QEG24345.1 hypothetical protein MFFC18_42640 [Mariniblastus fucicola]